MDTSGLASEITVETLLPIICNLISPISGCEAAPILPILKDPVIPPSISKVTVARSSTSLS